MPWRRRAACVPGCVVEVEAACVMEVRGGVRDWEIVVAASSLKGSWEGRGGEMLQGLGRRRWGRMEGSTWCGGDDGGTGDGDGDGRSRVFFFFCLGHVTREAGRKGRGEARELEV